MRYYEDWGYILNSILVTASLTKNYSTLSELQHNLCLDTSLLGCINIFKIGIFSPQLS